MGYNVIAHKLIDSLRRTWGYDYDFLYANRYLTPADAERERNIGVVCPEHGVIMCAFFDIVRKNVWGLCPMCRYIGEEEKRQALYQRKFSELAQGRWICLIPMYVLPHEPIKALCHKHGHFYISIQKLRDGTINCPYCMCDYNVPYNLSRPRVAKSYLPDEDAIRGSKESTKANIRKYLKRKYWEKKAEKQALLDKQSAEAKAEELKNSTANNIDNPMNQGIDTQGIEIKGSDNKPPP